MPIILYKAPNCIRCNIVKAYFADKGISYDAYDMNEQKEIVNTFYRSNRKRLYRNPEGVEFPMFQDTDADEIRQGSGVVLAWLLSGKEMDCCVTRSDLLHGWISGLYVSQCPAAQDDNFFELVRLLAQGGLKVCLQSDGRRPELLERILASGTVEKVILNIPGAPAQYPHAVGGEAPSVEDLKKSIALVKGFAKEHEIRLWIQPLTAEDGTKYWLSPEQAGEAAKWVAAACGEATLPITIQVYSDELNGIKPFEGNLLSYRSKMRQHLVKTDIVK